MKTLLTKECGLFFHAGGLFGNIYLWVAFHAGVGWIRLFKTLETTIG
jgi:hypothetical protein